MRSRSAFFGRALRLLLIAAALTATAYTAGLAAGFRSGSARPPRTAAPTGPAIVAPGADEVLALDQAARFAQRDAEAQNPHNLLFTADHSVYTQVGAYKDCTGQATLTHATAAIDTCVVGVRYFIGHNPGVFTGLMTVPVGGLIGYYDGAGHLHRLVVIAERTWLRDDGVPPPERPGEAAQFQTCVAADGSVDRILDAVEA